MSASISNPAAVDRQRLPFSEWLTLRRHPLPEYRDSLDALPPSLAEMARAALLPSDEVQGALFVPAEYHARKMVRWEYVPERGLVFLQDGLLQLSAESSEAPARTERLDAAGLLFVRSSILLLYGLLEIKADCAGDPAGARLEYNTVIWNALNAPLARFVGAACAPGERADTAPDARAANEELLRGLPFKFANGLRYYSLAPGERVVGAVFQPWLWQRRKTFVQTQVIPNTLLAVTDRKLVLIEEKRSHPWRRPAKGQGEYGWIFTYIPLDRVVKMSAPASDGLRELTIGLEWGAASETRVFRLEPAVADQWLAAWRAGGGRAAGPRE